MYAKFSKDPCTQKCRSKVDTPKKVQFIEQASLAFQHIALSKLKDPGIPIISCIIRGLTIKKALLDLEMRVNLLLSLVYELFGFRELKPTSIILQLADRSIKISHGMIEDMLVSR